MYKEKYDYPTVVKESTGKAGRVYFIELNGVKYDPVYSVTTILSRMSDKKEIIEEWKRTIGHKNAQQILDKSLNFGNCMHDILYHQIVGTPDYEKLFKQNFIFKVAGDMAKKIWEVGLKDVDEVWGAEVPLFVPECYAGRTDLVGTYKGATSIIDFKNAYKDKKEEHMEDYFTQAAAYAVAHDYLFNTNIEQCVIFVANSSNITAKKVIKAGDDFKFYKDKWIDILDQYYSE